MSELITNLVVKFSIMFFVGGVCIIAIGCVVGALITDHYDRLYYKAKSESERVRYVIKSLKAGKIASFIVDVGVVMLLSIGVAFLFVFVGLFIHFLVSIISQAYF